MQTTISFKKRCGKDPHTLPEIIEQGGSVAADGCPDIWELSNGDFAVIGIRRTREFIDLLPESAGCGPDEEIVLVPRAIMVNAKQDLPDHNEK
ncbi:MAG: hypothetical protein AAFZ15_24795 [Bacteroidota bacterium]